VGEVGFWWLLGDTAFAYAQLPIYPAGHFAHDPVLVAAARRHWPIVARLLRDERMASIHSMNVRAMQLARMNKMHCVPQLALLAARAHELVAPSLYDAGRWAHMSAPIVHQCGEPVLKEPISVPSVHRYTPLTSHQINVNFSPMRMSTFALQLDQR